MVKPSSAHGDVIVNVLTPALGIDEPVHGGQLEAKSVFGRVLVLAQIVNGNHLLHLLSFFGALIAETKRKDTDTHLNGSGKLPLSRSGCWPRLARGDLFCAENQQAQGSTQGCLK